MRQSTSTGWRYATFGRHCHTCTAASDLASSADVASSRLQRRATYVQPTSIGEGTPTRARAHTHNIVSGATFVAWPPDHATTYTSTRGFLTTARAIAHRCFCPPDNNTPRSPTRVSYPSGNPVMNCSALASRAAWTTSSCVASRLPYLAKPRDKPSSLGHGTARNCGAKHAQHPPDVLFDGCCEHRGLLLKHEMRAASERCATASTHHRVHAPATLFRCSAAPTSGLAHPMARL